MADRGGEADIVVTEPITISRSHEQIDVSQAINDLDGYARSLSSEAYHRARYLAVPILIEGVDLAWVLAMLPIGEQHRQGGATPRIRFISISGTLD
jgi:hypothetical protein